MLSLSINAHLRAAFRLLYFIDKVKMDPRRVQSRTLRQRVIRFESAPLKEVPQTSCSVAVSIKRRPPRVVVVLQRSNTPTHAKFRRYVRRVVAAAS